MVDISLLFSVRIYITLGCFFAALVIGWVMCLVNYSFLLSMLAFYLLASKATKFKLKEKSAFERDAEQGEIRVLFIS